MFINNKNFIAVVQVLKWQVIFGITAILLVSVIKHDINSSFSALLGLLCVLLPTIIYIRVAFVKQVLAAENVLKLHKKAMLLKFISNLILFALVFLFYKKCDVIVLFMTYIFSISGYWFSLLTVS